MRNRTIVGFTIGLVIGIVVGMYGYIYEALTEPEPECIRVIVYLEDPDFGLLKFGQQEICGRELSLSNVWGPVGAAKPNTLGEWDKEDRGVLR